MAAGDVSGLLWRRLVDGSRPRRFPRLPADRPVRAEGQRLHGRQGRKTPAGAIGRQAVDLLQGVFGHGSGDGPRRPARLVRGGLQSPRPRWSAAQAVGPPERRGRSGSRRELAALRYSADPRAQLAPARAAPRRQAAHLHGRGRHVLPGGRDPAARRFAQEARQRRGGRACARPRSRQPAEYGDAPAHRAKWQRHSAGRRDVGAVNIDHCWPPAPRCTSFPRGRRGGARQAAPAPASASCRAPVPPAGCPAPHGPSPAPPRRASDRA